MTRNVNEAFEAFLVEDMILTLSSVRGALCWLGSGDDCPPAARAEGFARISRQIAALEDRARDLWRHMDRSPDPSRALPDDTPDNVFDLGAMPLRAAPRAVFRSQRAEP